MARKSLKKIANTFTAGDQFPEIYGDYSGDLTGYVVEFSLRRDKTTTINKSSAGAGVTIIDAALGTFKITWDASDLVDGNGQRCQIRFIDGGGRAVTTQDFLIDVKAKD